MTKIPSSPKSRSWVWISLGVMILIVAVLAVVFILPGTGTPSETIEVAPLNFTEVVITDLFKEETFDGVIGSIQDDPIKTKLGGTITDIPEVGETIQQGEALVVIDNEPVILLYGDLPAYRNIAIGNEYRRISDQLNGTITWIAQPGTIIQQGDVLYRVDEQPIIALYGEQPAYRNLYNSGQMIGKDVLQLELSLVALGYNDNGNLNADGIFDYRTTRALRAFQSDLGLEQDSVLNLGEIIFLSGPSQVIECFTLPGDPAGNEVMEITTGNAGSGIDILQLDNPCWIWVSMRTVPW